jgi:hypothetical protein
MAKGLCIHIVLIISDRFLSNNTPDPDREIWGKEDDGTDVFGVGGEILRIIGTQGEANHGQAAVGLAGTFALARIPDVKMAALSRMRSSVGRIGGLGRLLKRLSLLHAHRVHDAFNLLQVQPFMLDKPLRIKQHGSFEGFPGHRDGRRTIPAFEG